MYVDLASAKAISGIRQTSFQPVEVLQKNSRYDEFIARVIYRLGMDIIICTCSEFRIRTRASRSCVAARIVGIGTFTVTRNILTRALKELRMCCSLLSFIELECTCASRTDPGRLALAAALSVTANVLTYPGCVGYQIPFSNKEAVIPIVNLAYL